MFALPIQSFQVNSQQQQTNSPKQFTPPPKQQQQSPTYSPQPPNNLLFSNHHQQQPQPNSQNNKSDDEDDWADNAAPIKIMPTIAPLATYDEHDEQNSPLKMQSGYAPVLHENRKSAVVADESSTMNNNHNKEMDGGFEYVDENNVSGQAVCLKAIALYDYQANDVDEISFDPNDIIVDIVQVSIHIIFYLV